MKKLLITAALFIGCHTIQAGIFEFWNKTAQPLYFEVGTEANPPMGRDLQMLNASGQESSNIINRLAKGLETAASKAFNLKVVGDYAQINDLDTNGKTLILLSREKNLKPGSKAVLITARAGKDVILRIKDDNNGLVLFSGDNKKYLVGPQTGPGGILSRLHGYSEHALSLRNNVAQNELTINPNYIITEKPLSEKEKELIHAAEGTSSLTEEQKRTIERLKELGMTGE